MSSNLQKLQLTYNAEQDRLLLTLATQDLSEYRLWITRRMLKALWDLLMQVQKALQKDPIEQKADMQQAASHIEKETPHPTASQYGMRMSRRPLGDEPVLLNKVTMNVNQQRIVHFALQDVHGNLIEFNGDAVLLTGLCQLIQQVLTQTDWGLTLA